MKNEWVPRFIKALACGIFLEWRVVITLVFVFQLASGEMTYAISGKKACKFFLKYSDYKWAHIYISGEFGNDSKNDKLLVAY